MTRGVAIDLGTVNTQVYTAKSGIIIDEPSVVALDRSGGNVLAVGQEAAAYDGRTPDNMRVIKPLREGVISELDACVLMLQAFLRRAMPYHRPGRLETLVCVPGAATDIERRALVEAADNGTHPLRQRQVHLIEEAVAAALGASYASMEKPTANGNSAGLPHDHGKAVLVLDIGGGTTEMGVVVGPGCVRSRSIRVGGNEMDGAIARAVRAEYGLVIGDKTAEALKMEVGLTGPRSPVAVTGVDIGRWGLLRTVGVAPTVVANALLKPLNTILAALTDVLAEVPADLAGEILAGGVHLAGGGSLLRGLSEWITYETRCRATVVEDPLRCVVRGLASLLASGTQARYAA
jgi:rod shape-determining protein MreB and related proteins